MLNDNRLNVVSKAPAFRLDGGDLCRLARHHYRLTPNHLSPFRGQPEDGSKLSPEAAALVSDPDLKRIAAVLAAPGLRVLFRTGGMARPPESFSVYCRREGKETVAVSLYQAGNLVETTYFDSLAGCCAYLMSLHAAPVPAPSPNLIKPEVPLEVMLLVLALVDCYRRAYLNGMLSGEAAPVEAVYEDEFLAVFEHELKSPDIRWLLPSFLRLVPGLTETSLVFAGEQMDVVRALGFCTRAAGPEKNRAVYLFGPALKYLGLEFTVFWNAAVGFEVSVPGRKSGKIESAGRYFLAPTAEANHLITIKKGNGGSTCTHQSLTFARAVAELEGLLQEHLNKTPGDAPAAAKKGGP
ncbi:MAG: hypothetical protein AB1374_09105 [Bacillota bacterium]